MANYEVVIKRIVSPDGKVIAEAKSVALASSDGESKISQSVTVNTSSMNGSTISAKSSSRSFSKISSCENQEIKKDSSK